MSQLGYCASLFDLTQHRLAHLDGQAKLEEISNDRWWKTCNISGRGKTGPQHSYPSYVILWGKPEIAACEKRYMKYRLIFLSCSAN